jgi:hypothetical protein
MHSIYVLNILARLRSVACWIFLIIPRLLSQDLRNPQHGILPCDIVPQLESRKRKCTPVSLNRLGRSMPQNRRYQYHQDPKLEDQEQKWYCALIIWYMLNQNIEIFQEEVVKEKLWKSLPNFDAMKNEDSESGTASLDDSATCFLRWYHSHSFVKICQKLKEEDPNRFQSLDINVQKHQILADMWQIKAEKSLRLFGQGRLLYHPLDQKVANLSALCDEISIRNTPLTQGKGSSILYTRDLIRHRPDTMILSPGRSGIVRWDSEHNIRSVIPRPGPWELNCLNHLISVSLGVTSKPEDCISACKEFMLSDYMFMTTFDQTNANGVGQWWDLDTSSMICYTILDQVEQRLRSRIDEINIEKRVSFQVIDSSTDSMEQPGKAVRESSERAQIPKSIQTPELALEHAKDDTRKILELLQEKTRPAEEFETLVWRKRRPGKIFHADNTVQSCKYFEFLSVRPFLVSGLIILQNFQNFNVSSIIFQRSTN